MAKKEKFTFKKEPRETGLRSVGYPNPNTVIKHNKKVVGMIYGPSWQTKDHKWHVDLTVIKKEKDDNPNCDCKRVSLIRISLKRAFNSEPEARIWLNENCDRLLALNLYHDDEE